MASRSTTRVNTKSASVAETAEATTDKTVEKTVPSVQEYKAEDMIPCRSITQGELILSGKRSGILYRWFAVGDIVEVEYQDLLALNSNRSAYLYEPYFVIEDSELLNQPRWKSLLPVYEKLYENQDMDAILNLPPAQLKQMLIKFPESYKKTIAIEVATRIERGAYDSIDRIKAIDESLGTDLKCLIKW